MNTEKDYSFIPQDEEGDEEKFTSSVKKKKRISPWTVLLVILVIVMISIIGYIGWKAYDYYHIPAYETGEISDDVTLPEETPPPLVLNEEQNDTEEGEQPYSENTVGYLTVPGVDITNEPVLQHPTDDNFYLNHDEYDNYSIWGSYFVSNLWNYESVEKMYPVSIIFGHSNGNSLHKKFSVLKKFKDVNFAREHRYIYLTLGEEQSRWKIFAAADYPVEPTYVIANPDEDYFRAEIENMKALSYNKYDTSVDVGDKILILSTCSGDNDYSTRFIVCAKLDTVY